MARSCAACCTRKCTGSPRSIAPRCSCATGKARHATRPPRCSAGHAARSRNGWSAGGRCLRNRLTRRGVIPSAALFATLLAEHVAEAALPSAVVHATTRAALCFAARQAGASAAAASLAHGAFCATRLARCSLVLLLVVGVAGIGAMTYQALRVDAVEPTDAAQPVPAPEQARPAGQPRLRFPVDPLPAGAVAQFGSAACRTPPLTAVPASRPTASRSPPPACRFASGTPPPASASPRIRPTAPSTICVSRRTVSSPCSRCSATTNS